MRKIYTLFILMLCSIATCIMLQNGGDALAATSNHQYDPATGVVTITASSTMQTQAEWDALVTGRNVRKILIPSGISVNIHTPITVSHAIEINGGSLELSSAGTYYINAPVTVNWGSIRSTSSATTINFASSFNTGTGGTSAWNVYLSNVIFNQDVGLTYFQGYNHSFYVHRNANFKKNLNVQVCSNGTLNLSGAGTGTLAGNTTISVKDRNIPNISFNCYFYNTTCNGNFTASADVGQDAVRIGLPSSIGKNLTFTNIRATQDGRNYIFISNPTQNPGVTVGGDFIYNVSGNRPAGFNYSLRVLGSAKIKSTIQSPHKANFLYETFIGGNATLQGGYFSTNSNNTGLRIQNLWVNGDLNADKLDQLVMRLYVGGNATITDTCRYRSTSNGSVSPLPIQPFSVKQGSTYQVYSPFNKNLTLRNAYLRAITPAGTIGIYPALVRGDIHAINGSYVTIDSLMTSLGKGAIIGNGTYEGDLGYTSTGAVGKIQHNGKVTMTNVTSTGLAIVADGGLETTDTTVNQVMVNGGECKLTRSECKALTINCPSLITDTQFDGGVFTRPTTMDRVTSTKSITMSTSCRDSIIKSGTFTGRPALSASSYCTVIKGVFNDGPAKSTFLVGPDSESTTSSTSVGGSSLRCDLAHEHTASCYVTTGTLSYVTTVKLSNPPIIIDWEEFPGINLDLDLSAPFPNTKAKPLATTCESPALKYVGYVQTRQVENQGPCAVKQPTVDALRNYSLKWTMNYNLPQHQFQILLLVTFTRIYEVIP